MDIALATTIVAGVNGAFEFWGKLMDAMSPDVRTKYADALAQPAIDLAAALAQAQKVLSGGK